METLRTQDAAATTLFAYDSPESIWNEHRLSTSGRDLDITGLSYALLEQQPQQWPFKPGASEGAKRLYADAVFPTPDGRARFVAKPYVPVAEPRESRYPFSLTTGRLRDQWHGMSRTGTVGRLFGHVAEPSIQMHPQDMQRRRILEGDLVHVTSKRGSIVVPVQASSELGLSQVFMAMHWGEEFLSGQSSTGQRLAGVNALTTSAYCPDSKQPEFKHAAVKVLKAELPWSLLGVAWLGPDDVLAARQQLQELMATFPFASCTPFASSVSSGTNSSPRNGVVFRAAGHEAPQAPALSQIESILRLDTPLTVRYADVRSGQHRAAKLQRAPNGDAMLEGFLLAGDTRAQQWMRALLQEERPAQAYARMLMVPGATPPLPLAPRGSTVCTCFNVSDVAIKACLAKTSGSSNERLLALQSTLQCGTNCGSCMPQLQRMVRTAASSEASTT
jgi:assimilatory nitrate reductase catalytic subunit